MYYIIINQYVAPGSKSGFMAFLISVQFSCQRVPVRSGMFSANDPSIYVDIYVVFCEDAA